MLRDYNSTQSLSITSICLLFLFINLQKIYLTGNISLLDHGDRLSLIFFHVGQFRLESFFSAMGAALHAAWVWYNENQEPKEINEIVEPFIFINKQLQLDKRGISKNLMKSE